MKKHLVLLLTLAATLMMASCTKENGSGNENEDRYYIRYEASLSSLHTGTMSLRLNTEIGEQIVHVSGNSYSETFGPVERGFRTSITASGSVGTYTTRIYVCRGEEPFVLKATGNESAEYVIDF